MRKKISKFILTIIWMLLAIAVQDAFAAFVVSPMEFHLNIANEEDNTQTFYVRNRTDETIALKVYTNDFWIEPDGNELFLEPGEVERSCAKWIEVTPEEMELAPDESQPVRFKINVPPEKTGTYWAMIFIEQITKPTIKTARRGEQQFNILSFQRVGVRIFEEIPGSVMGEAKISQVSAAWDAEKGLFKVDLRFENDGEVLLKGSGNIEIKDSTGETVKTIELKDFNCYPFSSRNIAAYIEEGLGPGQYTALAIVDYGAEYLVAGEAVFEIESGEELVSVASAIENETAEELEEEGIEAEEELDQAEEPVDLLEKIRPYLKRIIETVREKALTLWDKIKDQWQNLYKLYVQE